MSKQKGLSPRRRGNLQAPAQGCHLLGSIPAQAGEPGNLRKNQRVVEVYPRAGGGTRRLCAAGSNVPGLSPRRRGNRFNRSVNTASFRSIPAQAGEPFVSAPITTGPRVYPRAGGEPPSKASPTVRTRVYPRAGGGTRRMNATS